VRLRPQRRRRVWRVDRHSRFLADITGDGRVDIVGFGGPGVYVARNLSRRFRTR
jgi:hypothetical protein